MRTLFFPNYVLTFRWPTGAPCWHPERRVGTVCPRCGEPIHSRLAGRSLSSAARWASARSSTGCTAAIRYRLGCWEPLSGSLVAASTNRTSAACYTAAFIRASTAMILRGPGFSCSSSTPSTAAGRIRSTRSSTQPQTALPRADRVFFWQAAKPRIVRASSGAYIAFPAGISGCSLCLACPSRRATSTKSVAHAQVRLSTRPYPASSRTCRTRSTWSYSSLARWRG